jgi:hypothetical protein
LTANELATFAPNVAWWYNWRIGPGTAAIPAADEAHALDFVPMIWTAPFDSNAIAANITPTTKYLLTFNEPNFTSQGNLTPAQAASYWPQIEALADEHNLLIVSPALNFCAGGCNESNALVWLDEFFAACANCRVDYLALHAYVCYDAPLRSVYLDPFYQRYGKQIWLTEFSCGDGGADASQVSVQKTYMQAAVADLESNDAVFRYSWFIAKLDATSPAITLLDQNGKLTELGEFYVNLPQSCTP